MATYINLDKCNFHKGFYGNQRIAISLIDKRDGVLVATMTVNIPDRPIEVGRIIVKSYSENEGLIQDLIADDYVTDVKPFDMGHTVGYECSMTDKLRNILK